MRTAKGAVKVKPFQHKPKIRRHPVDTRQVQAVRLSAWDHIKSVSHRVLLDRINNRGTIYEPTDLRPRVQVSESRYIELMAKFRKGKEAK